jgi:chromosome partitioning protein
MKPYVIAICQLKGGVAKTTTASSVAAWLAEEGQRVLLIDLDPSANLTAGFGINPFGVHQSAADVLLGNDSLETIARASGVPGLDIVASNKDMSRVAQFLTVRPNYEEIMRADLRSNGMSEYDFVIVDCPPSLGSLTIAALGASHLAIVPTQCEYFSIQALKGIFRLINKVRYELNPELRYRLLITMFDLRGNLHPHILEKLESHYADVLFDTKIGFDSKLRASQLAGVPITEYAVSTRAAKQYQALVKEIMAYVK